LFGTKTDISVFMTHVAITIIVALLASLLIAQTLVPMLAARIKPPPQPKEGAFMSRLTDRYGRSLGWILKHPFSTGVGVIVTIIIGIMPMALEMVKMDMFPQDSGRRLFMPYHIQGQHPLERIEDTVDTIEDYLFAHQEEFNIRSIYSYYDKGRAESTLLLTSEDDATLSTQEIIEKIETDLPVIAIGKPSFSFDQQGGGGGESFSIQISGDSTTRLNDLALDVVRILESVEGLKDVLDDGELGEREIRVSIEIGRAHV
jgi:HAE1 family hydrophobic/amphiphilic exporter-1